MLLYTICCIISAILLCVMFAHYKTKKTLSESTQSLAEVKNQIRNLTDTDKMYERLGADDIKLEFGSGLLNIIDPQQDGKLLYEIVALRQKMTDELGYIIPEIRICDSEELEENEFAIYIHNSKIITNYIYPDRFFSWANSYEKENKNIPTDAILCIGPLKENCYWITKADSEKLSRTIKCLTPIETLIIYLKEIAIEYVNDILTLKDTQKYINIVKKNYSSAIADNLSELLSVNTLRQIFVNLIREKVSIKDIGFIFEKLIEYAKYTKDKDLLSEHLRIALQQQIINKYAISGTLFALTLSPSWEKLLSESIQKTELHTLFMVTPNQVNTLIETVTKAISETRLKFNNQPIVLCSPSIRLPLFQLLVKHIPDIVILSYSEITTGIKIEAAGEIK